MISDTLHKTFSEKVKSIENDRDRLAIFMFLCKVGTAREIMAKFNRNRQDMYTLINKYNHLGIDVKYRDTEWEKDLEARRQQMLKDADIQLKESA